ncbi:MAG: phosphatidate cytidylyltransferase [Chloroflexia bacterium]|nr:phosphatidate cytidylyltransferase [Chloroflexia bacterium]
MPARLLGSLAVVAIGLLPTIAGGPVFASLMVLLGVVGYREFAAVSRNLPTAPRVPPTGYGAIVLFAVAGLLAWPLPVVAAAGAAAVFVPVVAVFRHALSPGAAEGWALAVTGSFYLGLPVLAAIELRSAPGTVDAAWVEGLSRFTFAAWEWHPRGLAWVVLAILVTWTADTAAFLVGRLVGRRLLAARVSPKKTVEGAVGGVVGGMLVAVAVDAGLGLGLGPVPAALVGIGLTVVSQLGDLGESLLKRQAGVKDSSHLIPGHGGLLDRIDALLFVLPSAWFVAWVVDGSGTR